MGFNLISKKNRGEADFGWLKAKYYFSFASYQNPERMGFGKLRVLNDDHIEPGNGFATHPHKNMEIITIPLQGAVAHKDSEGHSGEIKKGEVQVMSAGSGIYHSEYNASSTEPLKLFQIWIEPNKINVQPRYEQKTFLYQDKRNQWTQLVSPMEKPREEGLKIYQNAYINISSVGAQESLEYQIKEEGHGLYILVAEGEVLVEGKKLSKRDAMMVTELNTAKIEAQGESEVIVIEIPLN